MIVGCVDGERFAGGPLPGGDAVAVAEGAEEASGFVSGADGEVVVERVFALGAGHSAGVGLHGGLFAVLELLASLLKFSRVGEYFPAGGGVGVGLPYEEAGAVGGGAEAVSGAGDDVVGAVALEWAAADGAGFGVDGGPPPWFVWPIGLVLVLVWCFLVGAVFGFVG